MPAPGTIDLPANVTPERVLDYDIYNVKLADAEYQLAVARLQDPGVPEILWTPHNGGHWIVTRAEHIKAVLNDWEHFSSRNIMAPKAPADAPKLKPLQVDPPNHTKYRALLAPALSPKAIESLGAAARKLAVELIEDFQPRGRCEFIGEFAQHLPIAIFMQIVDLPQGDRLMLTDIGDRAMRGETDEIRAAAHAELGAYGMQKVIERRARPGEDLISRIATARIDGELLDDDTLVGMITLLLLAGLDTVASTLGFFARFLALNPAHRRQLIEDPQLIPTAVEEMLRRFPVATLGREVTQDFEFGGVHLKAGDMVIAPTMLYGLDDRLFQRPQDVDFRRQGVLHATFGGGVHRCMGSMLARTELRVFLEEWLPRIPDFAIEPGAEVRVKARSVATIERLPLTWN